MAAVLAASSCTSTRACKDKTVLATLTFDSSASMADQLTVSVSVAGGTATTTVIDRASGSGSGTVEIDFPKGYPQGQSVTFAVVASHSGATVGAGSTQKILSDSCEAISIAVMGNQTGGGGAGGAGGRGGGGAVGGTSGSTGAGGGAGGAGGPGGAAGGTGGTAGTGGAAGGAGGRGGAAGGTTGIAGAGGTGLGGTGAGGTGTGGTGTGGRAAGGAGGGCPAGQTSCGGGCFVIATDHGHCGAACGACASTQVCNNACVTAAAPAFATVPADPTGWLDPNGNALTLTFANTGYPNAIYECRTGPDAAFTATSPVFAACDGGNGSRTTHTPTPLGATPEGNYRTEFRYRADTYTSPVIAARYYVHHSLDRVATCPRAGMAADGPHFADTDYFAAAQTFATANPTLFPVSSAFPAPAAIPARTDAIYLRDPFIKIPFVGVAESGGMYASMGTGLPTSWPAAGANYLFNERSLRHSWVINPAHTMILMKRHYVHPANHCRNEIWVGHLFYGTDYPNHRIDCEALVVNAHGNGLCFGSGGTAPILVPIESPANGGGTVTATANATAIVGVGTNFVGSANHFIQVPAVSGRWYKIAATPAPTATAITISPAYAGTTGAGQAYKVATFNTFNIPTGFAKMHPDAHNYATGATAPGTPSPKTKCEAVGCNTGRPWLTYLPP